MKHFGHKRLESVARWAMLAWDDFAMKWGPALFPMKLVPTFVRPYDVYEPSVVWRRSMVFAGGFAAPSPLSVLQNRVGEDRSALSSLFTKSSDCESYTNCTLLAVSTF